MKSLVRALVIGGIGVAGALVLAACKPPPPPWTLTVTTSLDGRDAVPGDGVCEMHAGVGDCSLRAAIDEANASAVSTHITIAPGVNPTLTIPGANEDANATGDLDIAASVTISGSGAGATIDGGRLDQVIEVHSGTLTLKNLAVTGGAGGLGGVVDEATLLLDHVSVTANSGGGIYTTGTVVVSNSTVSNNGTSDRTAPSGGIEVPFGSSADVAVVQSTIDHNNGGGIGMWDGTLTVDNSTFSDNNGAALVAGSNFPGAQSFPTVTITRSTFAGNLGSINVELGTATVSGSAWPTTGRSVPCPWSRAASTSRVISRAG